MKSFIVIGAGKFGHYFCQFLSNEDAEIMIVDDDENKISDMLFYVSSAKVGDCTRRDVVKGLGVDDFDEAVVCVPDSFQNSLQIVDLLKEFGAKNITAVASTEIQAKFLLKNGANHVIFPDRDMSERLAVAIANDSIFDFLKLSDDYGIYEIIPPKRWISQSILNVDVRKKYSINIVAIKTRDGRVFLPGPDYVFSSSEHLLVFGKNKDIDRLT